MGVNLNRNVTLKELISRKLNLQGALKPPQTLEIIWLPTGVIYVLGYVYACVERESRTDFNGGHLSKETGRA